MSGKQREFHGLAQGEIVVELSSAKIEPKKRRRADEEGEMVRGSRRNR